jgi:hypothetical protein
MSKMARDHKHCDDYIDDETQPAVLRKFLDRARQPAHGHMSKEPFPNLFATYNDDDCGDIVRGSRVRGVMASRMGDVGITLDLGADHGYQVRTFVSWLSDFSDTPAATGDESEQG